MLLAWLSHHPPGGAVWWLLGVLAGEWGLALLVWLRAATVPSRHWVVWAVVFRIVGLFATPLLEDDYYRYLWDGRMFARSGNPYGDAPSTHFADPTVPPIFANVLDHINYPDLPTIYGPVPEIGFLLSYLVAPAARWPWKLLLVGADVILVMMLRCQPETTDGIRPAVFAAWCPLSIFETAFNAHPDALGVSLLTAALAHKANRDAWRGVWSGLAVGARVFALPLVPFLLWRRRWQAWATFAVTLGVCYVPFWLQTSAADLTSLRVFAKEWEFNSSLYAVLAWAFGSNWARPIVALLFGAAWLGLFCGWARSTARPNRWPPGAILFGLLFLFAPTFNPWYALWLLPFVATRPSLTGVTALAVVSLSYLTEQNLGQTSSNGFGHPGWVRPLEFGLIAIAVGVDLRLRCRAGSLRARGV